MGTATTCLIVFASLFAGAMFGMLLRPLLPVNHLNEDSKGVVNLGAGIIGTMAALVLGLLVASAKGNYDTRYNEVLDASAKIALLDRILAQYGPEAKSTREQLRGTVANAADRVWPEGGSATGGHVDPNTNAGELIFAMIQALTPTNDAERNLKNQAVSIAMNLGQTRWLMFAQEESSVSTPLLVIVVFWLTINFISLGLFAPRNATVIATLLLCAVAVSGAIFLILEMYSPFHGLIHIPGAPIRNVLAQMGK
jgi:hypothetical protein